MDYISGLIPQDSFRSGLRKLAQGVKLRNSMGGRMWWDITNDECRALARQLSYREDAIHSEIAEVMAGIRQTAGITPQEFANNPNLLEDYTIQRQYEIKEDVILIDLAIAELCKDGGFVKWTTTGEWDVTTDKILYTVYPTEITGMETDEDKKKLLNVIMAVCKRFDVTVKVDPKNLGINNGIPLEMTNEVYGKIIS